MKKLISKIAHFFKNKKNTKICTCKVETLVKGKDIQLETGVMCDYYCHKHNMTILLLKSEGHLKDLNFDHRDEPSVAGRSPK